MMNYFSDLADKLEEKFGSDIDAVNQLSTKEIDQLFDVASLFEVGSQKEFPEWKILIYAIRDLAQRKNSGVLVLAQLILTEIPFTKSAIADATIFLTTICINCQQEDSTPNAVETPEFVNTLLAQLQLLAIKHPDNCSTIIQALSSINLNSNLLNEMPWLESFLNKRKQLEQIPLLTIVKAIIEEKNPVKHQTLLSNFFLDLPFSYHRFIDNDKDVEAVKQYLSPLQKNAENNNGLEKEARACCMAFVLECNGFPKMCEKKDMELNSLFEEAKYIPGIYHLHAEPLNIFFGDSFKNDRTSQLIAGNKSQFDAQIQSAVAQGYPVAQTTHIRTILAEAATADTAHTIQPQRNVKLKNNPSIIRYLNTALKNEFYAGIGYFLRYLILAGDRDFDSTYLKTALENGDIYSAFCLPDFSQKVTVPGFTFTMRDLSDNINNTKNSIVCNLVYYSILIRYSMPDTYPGYLITSYTDSWMQNAFLIGPAIELYRSQGTHANLDWSILAYILQDFVPIMSLYAACSAITNKSLSHEEIVSKYFSDPVYVHHLGYALSKSISAIFSKQDRKTTFIPNASPAAKQVLVGHIRALRNYLLLMYPSLKLKSEEVRKMFVDKEFREEMAGELIYTEYRQFLEDEVCAGLVTRNPANDTDGSPQFILNETADATLFNSNSNQNRTIQKYPAKKFDDKQMVDDLVNNALAELEKLDEVDISAVKQKLFLKLYETDENKVKKQNHLATQHQEFILNLLVPFLLSSGNKDASKETILNWLLSDTDKKIELPIKKRFSDKDALEYFPVNPVNEWLNTFKISKQAFFNNNQKMDSKKTYFFDVSYDANYLNELKNLLMQIIGMAHDAEHKGNNATFLSDQQKELMRFFITHSVSWKKLNLSSANPKVVTAYSSMATAPQSSDKDKEMLKEQHAKLASSSSSSSSSSSGISKYDPKKIIVSVNSGLSAPNNSNSNNNGKNSTDEQFLQIIKQRELEEKQEREKVEQLGWSLETKNTVIPVFIPDHLAAIADINKLIRDVLKLLTPSPHSYSRDSRSLTTAEWIAVSNMIIDILEIKEKHSAILEEKPPADFDQIKQKIIILENLLLTLTQKELTTKEVSDLNASLGADPKNNRSLGNPMGNPSKFINSMENNWTKQYTVTKDYSQLERPYRHALGWWICHMKEIHKTDPNVTLDNNQTIGEAIDELDNNNKAAVNFAELLKQAGNLLENIALKQAEQISFSVVEKFFDPM